MSDAAEEPIATAVIDAAMRGHSAVGPGLLESAYEACLVHDLTKRGRVVEQQIPLPVVYDGVRLEVGYRLDLRMDGIVVVEVKAVDKLAPIHSAQLLNYLKLSRCKLGLLLNFNVVHMRDGIKRLVNGL